MLLRDLQPLNYKITLHGGTVSGIHRTYGTYGWLITASETVHNAGYALLAIEVCPGIGGAYCRI